jgi:hypothetical protein
MLEQIISKAHHILKEARQKLSVESAAAVEQVCNHIVVLNNFIDKELDAVESNSNLDARSKKAARRSVFEQAGRKLEVIKAKRNYSDLSEELVGEMVDAPVEDASILQFFREKEVRDRLFSMTEAQILFLFGESLFNGSNPLLFNAILNAPPGFEPVSKGTIKKMQQVRAKKISPEIPDELKTVRNFNSMVEEIFSLVKKELDKLRKKELPTSLTQSTAQTEPPFKF